MKKILLTGASGFIGRQCLSPLIRRGYEVHAAWHKHADAVRDAGRAEWHHVDLLDRGRVSKLLGQLQPTHLLHCAWYAVPGKYWEASENQQWLDASTHLFRTFAELGGRRAVGVGTCAEYDWSFDHYSEFSTPLRPATTYGRCKLQVGTFLSELENETGLGTAWGRLFFLYGPHEDERRLVASVIISLLRNEPALCSHGSQIRDFLHVQDAGSALVALLDSEVTGPVNIASGAGTRIRDVVCEIAKQLGKPNLVKLGSRPAPENEPARLVADVARLRDDVGWKPEFSLTSGLNEAIKWWQARLEK